MALGENEALNQHSSLRTSARESRRVLVRWNTISNKDFPRRSQERPPELTTHTFGIAPGKRTPPDKIRKESKLNETK
jgi:hypothetical protein